MRTGRQLAGVVVAILGFWIALWGAHIVFRFMLGAASTAHASEGAPMLFMVGVAFVRVFGAVLFGLGAVLWASQLGRNRERAIRVALSVSAVFAALLAIAQQIAIWRGSFGYVLIGALVLVALVSAPGRITGPRERSVHGGAV